MNITKEAKLVNANRQAATPMASHRKISLTAGLLYLLTMVSIPTLALYGQVKSANYILGAGPDTPVFLGGLLEIIVALAGIGTAVALYPVLKRQNEGVALAAHCGRASTCHLAECVGHRSNVTSTYA